MFADVSCCKQSFQWSEIVTHLLGHEPEHAGKKNAYWEKVIVRTNLIPGYLPMTASRILHWEAESIDSILIRQFCKTHHCLPLCRCSGQLVQVNNQSSAIECSKYSMEVVPFKKWLWQNGTGMLHVVMSCDGWGFGQKKKKKTLQEGSHKVCIIHWHMFCITFVWST